MSFYLLSSKIENSKIAIVSLGYVGLPLAVAFAEKFPVIGLDINSAPLIYETSSYQPLTEYVILFRTSSQ